MSSILKGLVSFMYVVFAGISAPLSSFYLRIFLSFDAFLLFLVVFFFYLLSVIFFILGADKNQKKNYNNLGVMQRRL